MSTSIKDKIAALRAKTRANGCTEAEAMAAAALAAKLMGEHGLSEEDLVMTEGAAIERTVTPTWRNKLKVHNEVRIDILRADGWQLGSTVTRDVVRPFVAFNFGPQPIYPRVTFTVAEPEDVAALSNAVALLVPQGLKVSQRQVRSKLGLSEPEADDELLAPAAPPPSPEAKPGAKPPPANLSAHVRGCRCAPCLQRLAADPMDFTVDALVEVDGVVAAALDGWREITDPLLGPLLAAAATATSFDEALAALAARGPDGAKLLERLAVATAQARGLGDVLD